MMEDGNHEWELRLGMAAAALLVLTACLVLSGFEMAGSSILPNERLVIHVAHAVTHQGEHRVGGVYDWKTVPQPLYSVVMDIVNGNRTNKALRYVCRGGNRDHLSLCGGLSDRLRGIQMLLYLAAATGRRLEIDDSVSCRHLWLQPQMRMKLRKFTFLETVCVKPTFPATF